VIAEIPILNTVDALKYDGSSDNVL
jgi:hypothetical protein